MATIDGVQITSAALGPARDWVDLTREDDGARVIVINEDLTVRQAREILASVFGARAVARAS